jgi:hypothetical protein
MFAIVRRSISKILSYRNITFFGFAFVTLCLFVILYITTGNTPLELLPEEENWRPWAKGFIVGGIPIALLYFENKVPFWVSKYWGTARIEELLEYSYEGYDIERIAARLETTTDSVKSKLLELGEYSSYQIAYLDRLSKEFNQQASNQNVSSIISDVIQDAVFFDEIGLKQLLEGSENKIVEIKATLNVPQKIASSSEALSKKALTPEEREKIANVEVILNHEVVRAVASFLNTLGGYVIIGVDDEYPHKITGISGDKYINDDDYIRRLSDIIKSSLGKNAMSRIGINIIKLGSDKVCIVSCRRGPREVWCSHTKFNQRKLRLSSEMAKTYKIFYIRNPKGASELSQDEAVEYINENFRRN